MPKVWEGLGSLDTTMPLWQAANVRHRNEEPPMTRTRERAPAWVLEKIREERNLGYTYAAIAARLLEDGVPTPQGGTWSAAGIHYLLTRKDRDASTND